MAQRVQACLCSSILYRLSVEKQQITISTYYSVSEALGRRMRAEEHLAVPGRQRIETSRS